MQSIKEHNLKANHNSKLPVLTIWNLYAIYQRTQSESKSQLKQSFQLYNSSVCNLSKNTIWKQITTRVNRTAENLSLYAIYQRTQSESKSQLWFGDVPNGGVCMQSIKEHNLKANHNSGEVTAIQWGSVCNLSKNTIWKQITTIAIASAANCRLYAIYQRTQSESKSQRRWSSYTDHRSVCNLSKNTIWKQITTGVRRHHVHRPLYAIYQRTQSESKSQQFSCGLALFTFCMQSIKEHNLKANHNQTIAEDTLLTSVCNLSKNTIWKQITTLVSIDMLKGNLYAIYQRTQSESKSQPLRWHHRLHFVCMQSIKEHNLKANHNYTGGLKEGIFSVCNLSKNTIWKQITTQTCPPKSR